MSSYSRGPATDGSMRAGGYEESRLDHAAEDELAHENALDQRPTNKFAVPSGLRRPHCYMCHI